MKAIHAIWKDGRIVPTQPVDRPDGTPLTVEPIEGIEAVDPEGDLLGDDPASISRWIASFDALPPQSYRTILGNLAWRGKGAFRDARVHREESFPGRSR